MDTHQLWWNKHTPTTTTATTASLSCSPTHTHNWGHSHRTDCYDYPYDDWDGYVPPHMVVVGTLFIILALFLIFVSFRFFIFTMAAAGFIAGATVCWVLLTAAEPYEGYPHAPVVFLCACFGAGAVLAVITMTYWKLTLYLLGAISGYFIALYLWSWKSDHILVNIYARQFTGVGLGIVCAVAMLLVEFMCVIICTSFLGSYLFFLGLDLFIHVGMVNGPRSMLDANKEHHIHYELNNKVYAMLAGVLAFWLAGIIWQMIYNKGRRFGLDLEVKKYYVDSK